MSWQNAGPVNKSTYALEVVSLVITLLNALMSAMQVSQSQFLKKSFYLPCHLQGIKYIQIMIAELPLFRNIMIDIYALALDEMTPSKMFQNLPYSWNIENSCQ